jgi:O-acetyl-ADP-ribose deacetylase (regulator of RNase III)
MPVRPEAIRADITGLDVDAIVNAANPDLAPGGGVCGAIFRQAGPELVAACEALGGCPTGEARITGGFGLRARHIIHAVGPFWQGGHHGEPELLASAYRASLALASGFQLRSIAFPAISTGIYGYPLDQATRIAVGTIQAWLAGDSQLERVVFACFDEATLHLYLRELELHREVT